MAIHETADALVKLAFAYLGEDVHFSTLQDDASRKHTAEEVKAASVYEDARKIFLRRHPWSFARLCVPCASARLMHEGERGYAWQTPIPEGCLRVRSCWHHGLQGRWRLSGGMIESDLPLDQLIITDNVEDLALWEPEAREAFARMIAARLAKSLTGRQQALENAEQMYREALAEAMRADANEQRDRPRPPKEPYIFEMERD